MPFKNQHPLYNVWKSMRGRCLNPKSRMWNRYGGRGITICDRWSSFHAFLEDMGDRPAGHSLDRIDNEAGYSPENCRWADRKTQQRNQSRAVYVVIDGIKFRAIELADQAGIPTHTIVERAKRGLPLEMVINPEALRDISGLSMGGKANGAKQKAKTHCPHGHSYENAIISKEGFRRCRTCFYEKERRRLARKASADQ